MVVTLEDIEKQVADSIAVRFAMKRAISKLKDAESKTSPDVIKVLILGKRKMSIDEYKETAKRLGTQGLYAVEAMERLTKPQKQYLFKQLGYDINEVE